MPKLSETLQFTVRQSRSGSVVHDSTVLGILMGDQLYYSDKVQGDGYYIGHMGLHTVTYTPDTMVGSVVMQATLATDPTEEDWFNVDSTYSTFTGNYKDVKFHNFTGNYVWLRAKLTISKGEFSGILLNH